MMMMRKRMKLKMIILMMISSKSNVMINVIIVLGIFKLLSLTLALFLLALIKMAFDKAVSKHYHNWFNFLYLPFIALCTTYVVISNAFMTNPAWKDDHQINTYGIIMVSYFSLDNLWIIFIPFFTSKRTKYEVLFHHGIIILMIVLCITGYADENRSVFRFGTISLLMEWSSALRFIKIVLKLDNVVIRYLNVIIWFSTRLIVQPIVLYNWGYHIIILREYNTFVISSWIGNFIIGILQIYWTYRLMKNGNLSFSESFDDVIKNKNDKSI